MSEKIKQTKCAANKFLTTVDGNYCRPIPGGSSAKLITYPNSGPGPDEILLNIFNNEKCNNFKNSIPPRLISYEIGIGPGASSTVPDTCYLIKPIQNLSVGNARYYKFNSNYSVELYSE